MIMKERRDSSFYILHCRIILLQFLKKQQFPSLSHRGVQTTTYLQNEKVVHKFSIDFYFKQQHNRHSDTTGP